MAPTRATCRRSSVTSDGHAYSSFVTDRFVLADLRDTDGSAVMVHASRDNFANIPERVLPLPVSQGRTLQRSRPVTPAPVQRAASSTEKGPLPQSSSPPASSGVDGDARVGVVQ